MSVDFEKAKYAALLKVVDFQTGRTALGSVTARVDIPAPYRVVNLGIIQGGKMIRGQVLFNPDGSEVVGRNEGPRFRVIEVVTPGMG